MGCVLILASTTGLPAILTEFVNLVFAGGIPHAVRHAIFGSTLHALKKDLGLRQIAVRFSTFELLFSLDRLMCGLGWFVKAQRP